MSDSDQTGSVLRRLNGVVGRVFKKRGGAVRLWATLALGVCVAPMLSACDDWGIHWWHGGEANGDGFRPCPRPPDMSQMNGFNGQEREIRYYRHLAFNNDFFAQLELADRYAAVNASDKNIEDPIESSVWLVMALSNPDGYAPVRGTLDPRNGSMGWRYDKCREYERSHAYKVLDSELSMMDASERDKVRDRVIYVMSTEGAEGFRTLGRLYDNQYGPMGESPNNPQAIRAEMHNLIDGRPNVINLFERSDVDAYLYNYKAMETGDVSAYVLLKDFESNPERRRYSSFVEAKAKRWTAPYEFYPPDAPAGGVPHSDEARFDDAAIYAQTRIEELPWVHVNHALRYLNLANEDCPGPDGVPKQTIDGLRAMLGMPLGDRVTNMDRIRAIQLAAVNGDAHSQLVLAVMYSEGVGVAVDYARAFYWYQQAEKQGSPEARYAMSTYFDLGLAGVADQDKAEAVVMQLDSALAGFKPSATRLEAVLAQVAHSPSASQ